MLQTIIGFSLNILPILAAAFIICAQFFLLRDVYLKKMRPSILSWLGWAILMGTSFISQVILKWEWSLITLGISTCGCLFISLYAYFQKSYLITKRDWYFLFSGIVCMLIYLISKNPWFTTCFAILADFIVGIPTILLAYKNPASQKSKAWIFSFISWTITLIICINGLILYTLFPIYLFLYSGTMILLTYSKRNQLQT